MCGSHGGCVRLPNTDFMEYRYFYCDHDAVDGAVCATPWVYKALVAYRYVRIINITNFISYVLMPKPPSFRLVLLQSSLHNFSCSVHDMPRLLVRALKYGVARVVSTWPAVVSAWEGSSYPHFFLLRHPNLHLARSCSRRAFIHNATTRFLFADES